MKMAVFSLENGYFRYVIINKNDDRSVEKEQKSGVTRYEG